MGIMTNFNFFGKRENLKYYRPETSYYFHHYRGTGISIL